MGKLKVVTFEKPKDKKYLTLGDLRNNKDLPDNLPLIMAKDPEGNGFSPLSIVSTGLYDPGYNEAKTAASDFEDNYMDDTHIWYEESEYCIPILLLEPAY